MDTAEEVLEAGSRSRWLRSMLLADPWSLWRVEREGMVRLPAGLVS